MYTEFDTQLGESGGTYDYGSSQKTQDVSTCTMYSKPNVKFDIFQPTVYLSFLNFHDFLAIDGAFETDGEKISKPERVALVKARVKTIKPGKY